MSKEITPRKTYSQEEITRGLLAVAFWSGNTRKASDFLGEDGLEIPAKTLWNWSNKQHVEEYEQVRTKVLPKVREKAAEEHMALAEIQMEVAAEATEALRGKVDQIKPRDLSTTVRNMSTAAAIETDKAQLLGGQPTVRIQRDLTEVLRDLQARGLTFVDAKVVSEEDVRDAELVEG